MTARTIVLVILSTCVSGVAHAQNDIPLLGDGCYAANAAGTHVFCASHLSSHGGNHLKSELQRRPDPSGCPIEALGTNQPARSNLPDLSAYG